MVILLLSLVISVTYAQQSVELLNPSCEKVNRLDSPTEVLAGHPIQHQGNLGTCYANTSSLLFYARYKKDFPDTDLKQISWLSLAHKNKSHEVKKGLSQVFDSAGNIASVYESMKNKKFCGIPRANWTAKEFNSTLETNSTTLKDILEKYEFLFSDDGIKEKIEKNRAYISPTCFDNLNHQFDILLKSSLDKLRNAPSFSKFWPYLKEPKVESLRKLKDFYMGHIFASSFKKDESSALLFLSNDTFLNGPDTDNIDLSLLGFIDGKKKQSFLSDLYPIANDIGSEQYALLSTVKSQLEKQYIKCVEESLTLTSLIKSNQCIDEKTKEQAKDLVDFSYLLSNENISPKFIQELVTMNSPLRTKEEILEKFMKSFYENCKYDVPDNWEVNYIPYDFLLEKSLEANEKPYDFFHLAAETLIEQNLPLGLSVKTDFMRTKEHKLENGETHGMAIIGYAKGCKIAGKEKQKCFLVQNSWGRDAYYTEQIEEGQIQRPKYLNPGFKITSEYKSAGESFTTEQVGYGKFWVCDEDALMSNFRGFTVIR